MTSNFDLERDGGQIQRYDKSKIEDYNLVDNVIELHHKGFKYSRIAKEVNEILKKRDDGKDYLPVNHMNVKMFLENKYKEEEYNKPNELTKKHIDVSGGIQMLLDTITEELDKLRVDGEQVSEARAGTLLRLMKELRNTLEVAADLEQKAQPSITFNVFEDNITKFCAKIMDCIEIEETEFTPKGLSRCQKSFLLNMATEELFSNMANLKPVKELNG